MARKRYNDEDKFFKRLGSRIKLLRQEKGLTQEGIETLEIRFLQRVEAGKPIHMRTVLKVADALGISLEELFVSL